jgi:hypothetical protein
MSTESDEAAVVTILMSLLNSRTVKAMFVFTVSLPVATTRLRILDIQTVVGFKIGGITVHHLVPKVRQIDRFLKIRLKNCVIDFIGFQLSHQEPLLWRPGL